MHQPPAMQTLNPLDIPLSGKNLIQASAGTGKTWTISLLYVRLILEQRLTVDQLLVVTYTRAATDELRGRIRERLKTTLSVYENPALAHAEYETLLSLYPPDAERTQHVRRALLSFDEAAVFTIHGFCQRVLQQHAFEVGLPFESELANDESEMQLALADQFWQQRLVKPNALDAAVLSQHALTPDSLLKDVAEFVGKPYLEVRRAAAVTETDFLAAHTAYAQALAAVRGRWQQDQTELLVLLLDSDSLNQQSYGPKQVAASVEALASLLKGTADTEGRKALERLTPSQLAAKTKKGKTTPTHPFFGEMETLLEQHDALVQLQDTGLDQLRHGLLDWLRSQLPQRKRQQGTLAFDDLLVNLQDALLSHPDLAGQLAGQYHAALVDEFQDTDPVQYRVFEQIYRDSASGQVYYVGDPKQAIYSFRGADIHTYLRAAHSVDPSHQYTLDRNFRSQPSLLEAFNHLYARQPDPFRSQGQIGYETIRPGGTVTETLHCEPPLPPLRLWDWDGSGANGSDKAADALVQRQIAQAVAADIANLLTQGQAGTASIGGRPIHTGDFAVLVRSHRQGRLIQEALQACGIASVQKSPVGIFRTPEAAQLRTVLAGIAEPGQTGKLRAALVTELMGGTAQTLLELDNAPQRLDQTLEDFYRWQQLWQTHGFMRMLRDWLDTHQVRERLMAHIDGERRLTNLLHLGELIHLETRVHGQGMQATLRWLQQRATAERNAEEHQLRLESDENLVQIVTIHKSKGLQYPIVYCPFLWKEDNQPPKGWFHWYDADQARTCLQAGQHGLDKAQASRQQEDQGENLRLLYVALTRAQYHCTVVLASGEIDRHNYSSALGWLLFGHLPEQARLLNSKNGGKMEGEERQQLMHAALRELATAAAGSIGHEPLPVPAPALRYQGRAQQPNLQWRNFTGRIPPTPRIGSFSGLTFGQHDERPDYDFRPALELQPNRRLKPDPGSFPAGTRAGVCLHKMLERLDFQQPLAAQHEAVILRSLQDQGFGMEWQGAATTLLEQSLHAELLPNKRLRLADIPRSQRLDELEFYFPVTHLRLTLLQQVLLHYLPKNWTAIRAAVKRLGFNDLRGFMKGYMDLVFEADGLFYVVDYKSNKLGEQASDYAPARLHQAMADAHYYLQYLIYCLALHRYLKRRITGYSWDTHVGGVLYLFLRGLGYGGQGGVFFHKPDTMLMDALDGLMELD